MYDSAVMAEMDRRCCEYAEVVIASADELRQRCLRWNPETYLVTHGVDHAHFARAVGEAGRREEGGSVGGGRWVGGGRVGERDEETANNAQHPTSNVQAKEQGNRFYPNTEHRPVRRSSQSEGGTPNTEHLAPPPADLPSGPVIGFFGLLSEWVDQALLLRLARDLPQAQLVLIGKADVDVSTLKGVPNIHVLGPRLFSDLPAYLAHFTVGIIPFVVNDLTRAVNPIKLREMLSGGCPVVSVALPEVVACVDQAQIGGSVRVAQTVDEFVSGVRHFLEAPLDLAERRALSERMRQETWAAKVDEMLKIMGRQ
jgi:glycosyltransferase involved in cell wall biosynthesis